MTIPVRKVPVSGPSPEQEGFIPTWSAGPEGYALSSPTLHLDQSVLDNLSDIRRLLEELRDFFYCEPLTNYVQINNAQPLYIDKRNRTHLYIYSTTALELFYADIPGQSGQLPYAPFTVTAGRFQELPFRTGDKLVCPSIVNTAGIVVLLLAQNHVLAL